MPKDLGTRSWATVGSRAWQGCPTEGPSCWNWHRLSASGSLGGRACDEARPSLARSRKPTFLPAIPCSQSLPPQEMGPRGFLGLVCSACLAVLRGPPRHEIIVQSTDSLGRAGGTPLSALVVCLAITFSVEPQDARLAHSLWGTLAPPIAEPHTRLPSLPSKGNAGSSELRPPTRGSICLCLGGSFLPRDPRSASGPSWAEKILGCWGEKGGPHAATDPAQDKIGGCLGSAACPVLLLPGYFGCCA